MEYFVVFDKNYNISFYVENIMRDVLDIIIKDNIMSDVLEEYPNYDTDKFVQWAHEIDYSTFRKFLQKYNISTKRITINTSDTETGAYGLIYAYNDIKQFKKALIYNCKNLISHTEPNSMRYNEAEKLIGKIKLLDDINQIIPAVRQYNSKTGTCIDAIYKHFSDFDDYLKYIFDNQ